MLIYIQMIESPEARSKFEDLYLHYRGLMLYVAAHIVGGGADAEDAVHQAFLSIAENMDRLGAVKSAETHAYVVTITENKAIDILRSRREVPTDLQQEDGLTVPPPSAPTAPSARCSSAVSPGSCSPPLRSLCFSSPPPACPRR